MQKKSKHTYESGHVNDEENKGSVTEAGYNEQTEKTVKHTTPNPADTTDKEKYTPDHHNDEDKNT